MNPVINQLAQSLFQKEKIEDCSEAELEQLTKQYPYFSAGHLLLAAKKNTKEKAAVFFHNPLWLRHVLKENSPKINIQLQETTDPEHKVNTDTPTVLVTETAPAETITPVAEVSAPIPDLKTEPPDPAKTELFFQPYHAVDYFASQGIRFREEEKPADKFGQQLRSFTEWLKTMKRLPVETITAGITVSNEQKVEQLAEHSLQEKEVLTETMAEVWEKQGNNAKAIEIYGKLSLLDPSKSTYFAAKIEDLKKIN